MKLTYEEQLRLDNNKEHLIVVQSNLRIANDKLNETLDKISMGNLDIVRLCKKQIKIEEESILVKKNSDLITTRINEEKELLISRKTIVDEKEKELKEDIIKVNNILFDINDQIRLKNSEYEKLIKTKSIEIEIIEDKIRNLKEEKKNEVRGIEESSDTKIELEREVIFLKEVKDRLVKKIDKIRIESINEMNEITEKIEDEKEKINNPLKLMEFETRKLNNYKRNLDVLRGRLLKQFSKQNPNRILPIELQEKNNNE